MHALPKSIKDCSVSVIELIISGLRPKKCLVTKEIDMLLNANSDANAQPQAAIGEETLLVAKDSDLNSTASCNIISERRQLSRKRLH